MKTSATIVETAQNINISVFLSSPEQRDPRLELNAQIFSFGYATKLAALIDTWIVGFLVAMNKNT